MTPPLEDLAGRIERAFPDLLRVRPLTEIGCGFRSIAYQSPGGCVVRVGRSPDALADYEKEWRIGRWLAARLGPIVPHPRWFAPASDDLPYGAMAYRKLEGRTPPWGSDPGAAFGRDLGAFMAKLHALPIEHARAAGVPDVDAYKRMLGARPVVTPVLRQHLTEAQFEIVDGWWQQFAADERMHTTHRTVCHHDLWHDNLLISGEGRLAGVLDIAHVEITDPAHDFAAPRHFGEAFFATLIAAYRDARGSFRDDIAYRAQRYWEAREFGGLAWAIEHNDEAEVNDALDKIRRGPLFE